MTALVPKAVIFSVEGFYLGNDEKDLFQDVNPLGFILFKRNCQDPEQLKALTDSLRESVNRDCPILIDQEGGRVQRLAPPHWKKRPPAKHFGDLIKNDSHEGLDNLQQTTASIARELQDAGITVNCAPVLDIVYPDTHEAIGDRAYSADPAVVQEAGREVCKTYLENGITPVIKHLPGQGRAASDSHEDLPVVDVPRDKLARDFLPFQKILEYFSPPNPPAGGGEGAQRQEGSEQIWGMTSHILYPALDSDLPASVSPAIIEEVIRGEIGLKGLLFSDDLSMEALEPCGSVDKRALKVLEAGCDVALYCAGHYKEMKKMADNLPELRAESQERYERSYQNDRHPGSRLAQNL